MVRPVGLEPTLPKKTDFESVASTDSATVAYVIQTFVRFAVTGLDGSENLTLCSFHTQGLRLRL